MTFKKLQLAPGVNKEGTRYTAEGRWWSSSNVRFRQGLPEKIGGWVRLSNDVFVGVCRAMFNWVTLTGANLLAVGTHLKYYLELGTAYYDVTPIRTYDYTAALTNPFSTTLGSATVTVTDVAHGTQTGDLVYFTAAVAVGGVPADELNARHIVTYATANTYTVDVATLATSTAIGGGSVSAEYRIQAKTLIDPFSTTLGSTTVTVVDATNGIIGQAYVTFSGAVAVGGLTLNGEFLATPTATVGEFTITAATPATSTAVGGGSVLAAYQINMGTAFQVPLGGWGAGTYGSGVWGNSSAVLGELLLWSQSNFGEDLIFCQRYGGVYHWSATNGVGVRAVSLSNLPASDGAPTASTFVFVSDVFRFLIAFGCNEIGSATRDPMLIRWADQETMTDWVPSATNQAGSLRLSHGVEIKSCVQAKQEILVFTDSAVYSLQYLGAPAVWGATLVADNVSLPGPNGVVVVSGVAYWMGSSKFYMYDGTVTTLPCDLRQHVFGDFNYDQQYQVYAGTNERFNEVWWFYCTANADQNDAYVVFNYADSVWYYGSMSRTAWVDPPHRTNPIAAFGDRLLYHESGVDDVSGTTPVALSASVSSGEFDIDDGDRFGFVDKLLPDITFRGSTTANPSVVMTLEPLANSGSGYGASVGGSTSASVVRSVSVPVEEFTGQIYVRVRGRQMTMTVESSTLGTTWQLGAPRINIRPDGRR